MLSVKCRSALTGAPVPVRALFCRSGDVTTSPSDTGTDTGARMPSNNRSQLTALAGVCRRLTAARQRVAELEAERDALIGQLRELGVPGAFLAEQTGLSAGRVTQIAQANDGTRLGRKRRATK